MLSDILSEVMFAHGLEANVITANIHLIHYAEKVVYKNDVRSANVTTAYIHLTRVLAFCNLYICEFVTCLFIISIRKYCVDCLTKQFR